MIKKTTDVTVTKNSDYDNELFLEEYEAATAGWTKEERDELPPSEIDYIVRCEFSNAPVEYTLKIKE